MRKDNIAHFSLNNHPFTIWTTAGETDYTFSERNLHYDLCYNHQQVGDIVTCSEWDSQQHLALWPTESEQLPILLNGNFIILSYDQQQVSSIPQHLNQLTSFPMTNRWWVTFDIVVQGNLNLISSCPDTNSKLVTLSSAFFWNCILILSNNQQEVSHMLLKGSVIMSCSIINRE